ncbi:MAG: lipoyl(octanoyl) transferase LipB [Thermodesulfobacteriota bacterium]
MIFPEKEIGYAQGLALQEQALSDIIDNGGLDTLVLMRNTPSITLGYFAKGENILAKEQVLRERGIKVYRTGRGGDVTYHGPGQLIGYPVIDTHRKRLRDYKSKLCASIIEALAHYGIEGAEGHGKLSGIWVKDKKIAAVGYAFRSIRNWYRTTVATTHGFALNVLDEMENFTSINPCGMPGMKLTSMEEILGCAVDFGELREHYVNSFSKVFDYEIDA